MKHLNTCTYNVYAVDRTNKYIKKKKKFGNCDLKIKTGFSYCMKVISR